MFRIKFIFLLGVVAVRRAVAAKGGLQACFGPGFPEQAFAPVLTAFVSLRGFGSFPQKRMALSKFLV